MYFNSFPYYYPVYNPYLWMTTSQEALMRAPHDSASNRPPTLMERIEKIIQNEHHAIQIYESMLRQTGNSSFKKILMSIIEDEKHHFHTFSKFYSQMTHGKKVTLTDAKLPKSFVSGVDEAIPDELEDSKYYQNTAEISFQAAQLKEALMNASHDEQRHATWFLYIQSKMKS